MFVFSFFMKKNFLFILCLFFAGIVCGQADTSQKIVEGRLNSAEQQQKPYVILISADGFRYDYAEKYHANNLLALSAEGVKAAAMIPSYPSLTFPNHYTIVTGLYPSHHGLVNNYFFDRNRKALYGMHDVNAVRDGTWYGGTPLWVLAEQQHLLTASFFWVGSEADIKGILPTYYYRFERRINVVVNWLQLPADKRPHFITFYISQADHAGHMYGPDSPETAEAVRSIDSTVQKLTYAVKQTGLPVNFIFVSDHGMTGIDVDHNLTIPHDIDTSKFIIPRGAEVMELYAKDKDVIKATYKKLKKEEDGFMVYLRANVPARLHYGKKDDRMSRIGDILVIPRWPWTFNSSTRKPLPGAHGYDPSLVKDMLATFYAWGPAFKDQLKIPEFENVDVYPLVTKILGLTYREKIDGSPKLAEEILKQ
jgi:predicted AlkP superfamily pyrophosphatase or phosphodiesterase